MTSKIRDKYGLPLTRALLCGCPQSGLLVSHPKEMLPPVCFHPLSVTIVPLSQSVSANQTTSLASLVNRRWVCCCWLSLVQLQERNWDSCRLTVDTEAHILYTQWVGFCFKLLNSKRTKCQRVCVLGQVSSAEEVCQGGLKGSARVLHPGAIWLECLKGIPRSSGSALLFINTGTV